MNIVGHIKVDMAPVSQIMKRLGVTAQGDVQRFHTAQVLHRIVRYMPYRTGATHDLMVIQSPIDEPFIHVDQAYAHYLYEGKVWVDPKTGKAGFLTKNGWMSRPGCKKVKTNRDITYTKTEKNPQAGPHWDRLLIAAEGAAMRQDLQAYVNRRAGG